MKKVTLFLFTIIFSATSFAREYVEPFTPVKVIVADGFLQIYMPSAHEIEGCINTRTIVLPDTHKYFDAFLSLSSTAFVTQKKLNVAIGAPCQGSVNWPMIHVMMLQN